MVEFRVFSMSSRFSYFFSSFEISSMDWMRGSGNVPENFPVCKSISSAILSFNSATTGFIRIRNENMKTESSKYPTNIMLPVLYDTNLIRLKKTKVVTAIVIRKSRLKGKPYKKIETP